MAISNIASAFISLAIAGCSYSTDSRSEALQPIAVSKDTSRYVGKNVEIKGYLRYGDDARGIWTSQSIYREAGSGDAGPSDAIWANCISLNADSELATRLKTLNEKWVILAGVIVIEPSKSDEVFSFACNDVVLKVGAVLSAK